MNYEIVEKTWGHEKCIFNEGFYCLKDLVILKDKWTSNGLFHYHKLKVETFYVESGEMLLEVVVAHSVCRIVLLPGDSYTVYPLSGHRFTSRTDVCRCFNVSTQDITSDSYRCTWEELPYNE